MLSASINVVNSNTVSGYRHILEAVFCYILGGLLCGRVIMYAGCLVAFFRLLLRMFLKKWRETTSTNIYRY